MKNAPSQDNNTQIPRRTFLKKFWIGLGVMAGIETLFLTGNFLFPKRKTSELNSDELFAAGQVDNFKKGSVTPFRNHQFFLSRTKEGGFLALSIKCSHLGCNLIWEKENNRFVCPCHSSWFDKKGDVMHPPATRPLSVHPVIIEQGVVKVNTKTLEKRNSIEDTEIVFADKKG